MASPSPVSAAVRCVCPRCGEAGLFQGLLTLRTRCPRCGLGYADVDVGDGPAIFVIFFVSVLVGGLALWVEFTFEPPLWLHVVLWAPIITILAIGLSRAIKAFLVAQTWRHRPERFRS